MTDKSISGLGLNSRGSGSGGGAPTDAAYIVATGMGAGALTQYRVAAAGTGISITDGGALGNIVIANTGLTEDKSADGLWRWVQDSGDNVDDGSVTHPKLTVASANSSLLAHVPPPTFGAGGAISVGPGLFAALSVILNVAYRGISKSETLMDGGITFPTVALAPSLTSINEMNFINNPVTIDTSVCPGAIVLFDINSFSTATTIADPAEPTTQLFFLMCVFGNTLTINGGSSLIFGQCLCENNVTLNSSAAQPIDANFQSTAIMGNVDINFTAGHAAMVVDLSSTMCDGNITITAGGAVAASVTVTLPADYGTLTVTAAAGVVVFVDNGSTASGLVFNNGLTKAVTFAGAAPASNQCLMFDGAGLSFPDFVRAWYLTVAGGGQVILVQDASSLVNGNVLQIVDDAVTPKSAAFQPPNLTPSTRFTSMGFQYKGNWNYTYTASGGNADVAFSSMNGGLAPDTYGSFDPLSSFVVSAAAMASILLTTTSTQVVKFCVSGSLSYGFGTSTDDNATYLFQLKQAGGSLKNLSRTNATSMYNNQLAPAVSAMYPNMSGSNTANITAGTSLFELYLVVSGSDNAAHNLVFDNIEFRIEMWN